jgi:hypothetical protein
MQPNAQPGITSEQLKAKFAALTPANRSILAQKLALQLDTIENNRQLAILSFEDGTDQFSAQKAQVVAQQEALDSVINPVTP